MQKIKINPWAILVVILCLATASLGFYIFTGAKKHAITSSSAPSTSAPTQTIQNQPTAIASATIPPSAPVINNTSLTEAPAKQNANTPAPEQIWNLQNADIKRVINYIEQERGYTFEIDPRLTGNVTIMSTQPASPEEGYQLFLSALQSLGFSVVPADGNNNKTTFKIVPITNMAGIPIATGANATQGNQVVVQVIPVVNQSATQLVPILRPFLPAWASMQAYDNMLIIAGTANDINNIKNIISSVDTVSHDGVDDVILQNATATNLASILNASNLASGRTNISITADADNNSILLSGDKIDRLKMRALISTLDKPTGTGADTQVIHLNYLTAKDFAPILGTIVSNSTNNAPNPLGNAIAGKTNDTNVQAVPDQNALIVTAPPQQMKNIREIIAELDVRPAQVLIEAAIVEIDESQAQNLGVQWGSIMNSGSSGASTSGSSDLSGGLANAFTNGVGIIRNGNFQLLVHAISDSSGANILSTPSIVVLNNHEANIDVGKQINVQSESQAAAGIASTTPTSTITSTFKQQQVALTLDVKPQINEGETMELHIKQKNDTLQDPDNPSDNPIINISGMSTDVEVHSNDILILGGLIKNELSDSESKIPILGDIPVLGNAFKYKNHKVEKTYLMVFIHPIILRNSADDTAASNSKYDYIRKIQLQWGGNSAPSERVLAPRPDEPSAASLNLPAPFTNAP